MSFSGTILAYDPGVNRVHVVAFATVTDNQILDLKIRTPSAAEDVIKFASRVTTLDVLAVVRLTIWSTGLSGWRPADLLLKKKYKKITNSIASTNSLFGTMGLNA